MPNPEQDLSDLRAVIEAAFRDAPQPQQGEPILACTDPGSAQILSAFEGKAWQDVKPRSLLRCGTDPMFQFTPKAFVYYLQAYMQAMVADPERYAYFWEMLNFTFTPVVNRNLALKRVSFLSEKQCLAVVEFLDAFASAEDRETPATEGSYGQTYQEARRLLLSRVQGA